MMIIRNVSGDALDTRGLLVEDASLDELLHCSGPFRPPGTDLDGDVLRSGIREQRQTSLRFTLSSPGTKDM